MSESRYTPLYLHLCLLQHKNTARDVILGTRLHEGRWPGHLQTRLHIDSKNTIKTQGRLHTSNERDSEVNDPVQFN